MKRFLSMLVALALMLSMTAGADSAAGLLSEIPQLTDGELERVYAAVQQEILSRQGVTIPSLENYLGYPAQDMGSGEYWFYFDQDPSIPLARYIDLLVEKYDLVVQQDYGWDDLWCFWSKYDLDAPNCIIKIHFPVNITKPWQCCICIMAPEVKVVNAEICDLDSWERPVEAIVESPEEADASEPAAILLADALDASTLAKGSGDMMDFSLYAQDVLKMEELNVSKGRVGRSFRGTGYEVVSAYVDLLCSEYDFELVGEPYYLPGKKVFYDFVLRYTGDKNGVDQTVSGTYSHTEGNVMLYGIDYRSSSDGTFYYDDGLTVSDDGYRYGQPRVSTTKVGQSLGAGLYLLPDGSFQTGDGRLTTTLGKAAVLRDGTLNTYDAQYEIQTDHSRLRVTASKNGAIHLCFYMPSSQDWTVGLFDTDKFIIDSDWAVKQAGVEDNFPQFKWKYMLSAIHGDDYVFPVRGFSGEMTDCSLRVMYLTEEVGVFYVCATFDSAPYTMEALIALPMDVEPTTSQTGSSSSSSSSWCIACSGSGKCSTCSGTGKVKEYMAGTTTWLSQTCTSCSPVGSGKCRTCRGTGKK